MRPPHYSRDMVIAAGESLLAADPKRRITGTLLRSQLGGGSPKRLADIWSAFAEDAYAGTSDPEDPLQTIEHLVAAATDQQARAFHKLAMSVAALHQKTIQQLKAQLANQASSEAAADGFRRRAETAEAALAKLKSEHQHLTLASHAVTDLSNDRGQQLRVALEREKLLKDSLDEARMRIEDQRIELGRAATRESELRSALDKVQRVPKGARATKAP